MKIEIFFFLQNYAYYLPTQHFPRSWCQAQCSCSSSLRFPIHPLVLVLFTILNFNYNLTTSLLLPFFTPRPPPCPFPLTAPCSTPRHVPSLWRLLAPLLKSLDWHCCIHIYKYINTTCWVCPVSLVPLISGVTTLHCMTRCLLTPASGGARCLRALKSNQFVPCLFLNMSSASLCFAWSVMTCHLATKFLLRLSKCDSHMSEILGWISQKKKVSKEINMMPFFPFWSLIPLSVFVVVVVVLLLSL